MGSFGTSPLLTICMVRCNSQCKEQREKKRRQSLNENKDRSAPRKEKKVGCGITRMMACGVELGSSMCDHSLQLWDSQVWRQESPVQR